jgi:hypothetical protein
MRCTKIDVTQRYSESKTYNKPGKPLTRTSQVPGTTSRLAKNEFCTLVLSIPKPETTSAGIIGRLVEGGQLNNPGSLAF